MAKTKRKNKISKKTRTNRNKSQKKIIIGKIYADWCIHCKHLKPNWMEMKRKIKENMGYSLKNAKYQFVELGDSLEKELSLVEQMHTFNMKHFPNGNKEISSDGFPTIFKICRKKIDYFQGDRNNINNLYDWATHNC